MAERRQVYFAVAEEQGSTGHTHVLTGSFGIPDSICWRNMTGTPPEGMTKRKMLLFIFRLRIVQELFLECGVLFSVTLPSHMRGSGVASMLA